MYESDTAEIAGKPLQFHVRGWLDELHGGFPGPARDSDYEQWRREAARHSMETAEALEAAIAAEFPGLPVRVRAKLDPELATGGPGIPPPSIVALLLTDDPLGRIADFIALAQGLKALIGWVRRRGGSPFYIDDGVAFLVGADAVYAVTGRDDLSLEFVVPIRSSAYLTPPGIEWEGEIEGYLVGFRDERALYQVPVSLDGTTGEVTTVTLDIFVATRDPTAEATGDISPAKAGPEPPLSG
jgi:hypothetical protein